MASTPIYNWPTPDNTDLVKNGALAIRTLGDAIDTTVDTMIPETIFAAKGDLLGASANDTPAVLTVGADGETLVADSSTSTGLSYQSNWAAGKNKIINGDFAINQRAFTSVTTSAYGFDRWITFFANGTNTYTPQTFSPGAAPVAGYEATNFARLTSTGQTLSSAATWLRQLIEDVRTFAGQTITVSFWAKADSGTPNIAIECSQNFAAGGSARVDTYAGQVTLSTSWARYSVTVAIPSISGKTIGTGSSLITTLMASAGTDFNARSGSLGIQSNTFDFWGVQVEAGSVATAFQTATGTIQGELAACQRYFVLIAGGTSDIALSNMSYYTATDVRGVIQYPVTMRVSPTVVSASGTDFFAVEVNGAKDTINFLSATRINPQAATVFNQTNAASTAGFAGYLITNSASASLAFSAEL
jgi:hypothetical protein